MSLLMSLFIIEKSPILICTPKVCLTFGVHIISRTLKNELAVCID